jgi:predicted metal-dependent peptidase
MKFALDEVCKNVATDGVKIYFNPAFLDSLSDTELDYVLMHEILHIALQQCENPEDNDKEKYTEACDIVVNSMILESCDMNEKKITLDEYGVGEHRTPDGKEGSECTVEEVYEMLSGGGTKGKEYKKVGNGSWDDHSRLEAMEKNEFLRDLWLKWFEDACEAMQVRDPENERGLIPRFALRMLKELKKPQTDWRTILNNFVQEDIVDYSFMPPDRRMDGSDFFLPDFNEKDEKITDILFMVDTSGSMTDDMITAAYSEIKGAIDQFNGKLKGWLGFFDVTIIEPVPFEDESELLIIKPVGGGGTDFNIIFEYIREHMQENMPASIIIFTDGYAPFPSESISMGIPVLWLINNEEINPPWGKVARISIER